MMRPTTTIRQIHSRESGFSLIEVMVSIVIALILLAGIIQLFVSNKQGYRLQEGLSILNENARFAVARLQHDLRMADHWGGVNLDSVESVASVPGNDCFSSFSLDAPDAGLTGTVNGLYSFDGDSLPSQIASCINAYDAVAGTDVIVVRYADQANAGDYPSGLFVYTQRGRKAEIRDSMAPATNTDALPFCGAIEDNECVWSYYFAIYFVRRCDTPGACPADDSLNTPALVKLVLDGGNIPAAPDSPEIVVSGIEQMQVEYGLDTDGNYNANQYLAADNAELAGNPDNWAQVVSARIDLLIRSSEKDISIDEEGETQAMASGYTYTVPAEAKFNRRKLFSTVVEVRNQTRS